MRKKNNNSIEWNGPVGSDGLGFIAECSCDCNESYKLNLVLYSDRLTEQSLKDFAEEIAELFHQKYE